MSNPFQDQLLKAGLVTKKQVQKANQDKSKKHKKQRSQKARVVDEDKLKAQQAAQQKAAEKSKRDRELNQQKQAQAKQKAISIEINQLIENNTIERDDNCELVYNFEHNKKVRRIYVNEELRQSIISGKSGIARIEGRYELVPLQVAEKILDRNPKRIIIFKETEETSKDNVDTKTDDSSDDPYAGYDVPDDLVW